MINVENIGKSYGGRLLFENVSFKLNSRERVGVIGRNGHGKTTLFRTISGDEEPDEGVITFPKYYRIGYVRQQIDFTQNTVLEEGLTGLPPEERDNFWQAEKILSGLGFSDEDMQRHPSEFSGGFQVRLNLAKELISDPDLLLLDEPTNYLDITSIRWIERFLSQWPHELMLITHDRSFMDKVITHTIGLHRGKARKMEGDTGKYYAQIAQEEEIYEKTRANDEKRRKEVELFITRFRAKARLANMVQSRIKTLAKMEKRDKLEKMKTLDFAFREAPFTAKRVMAVKNIHFGYDPLSLLISDLNMTINTGERICVVGKNGKGKTTLLKLLAGKLQPQKGEIKYHNSVVKGFFEQTNIQSLVGSNTVEDEILYSHADVDRQKARNACGAMMFSGDDALKKISVLSGGEKSRVMLGKLLVSPVNLLLLDEPTNHLDMEACDSLLAAIDGFEGAVIMVTHNELFLHALAQRLIVFQDDRVSVFEGDYQYFLDKKGWGDGLKPKSLMKTASAKAKPKFSNKKIKRKRSEIIRRRGKALNPLKKQITNLENKIEIDEKRLSQLNQQIADASEKQNSDEIIKLSQDIHARQKKIDTCFDELETLTEKLENQNISFEKELAELE
ncbi:ATP-binding cassette domain-containing protein [Desulfococcaceae bacterium HSG9]|nr:ATP-binding cassette domain-containing protein [Desulfococcaceae bacterium HSG9]